MPMPVTHASSDDELIKLFLGLKDSENTKTAYIKSLGQFRQFVNYEPLQQLTLDALVAYRDYLVQAYPSLHTVKAKINAVKSLLTFAAEVGYIRFNVGAALKAPKTPDRLSERIVDEETIFAVINAAKEGRNKILVRLLYATGCRISEVIDLEWRSLRRTEKVGYVNVIGKGMKERTIAIKVELFDMVLSLKPGNATPKEPVFVSQKGSRLSANQAWRIVKQCGSAVGVPDISPHWFRHAHATHAVNRGVDVNLIKDTLGHSSLAITDRYLHSNPEDSSALYLAV